VYLLNNGVQVDKIVKLAKLLQTHPDVIQTFMRSEGEQNKHDEFPKSISSSTHFSFFPSISSSSSSSPTQPYSSSSFHSQPQKTIEPTLQKSASPLPMIEPESTVTTTKPSIDKVSSSDKESEVQSFAQIMPEKQQPPMKEQHAFPRAKPDLSTRVNKSYQPLDMGSRENNKNLDKVNSNSPTRTATFRCKEVCIPNSILLGFSYFNETQELWETDHTQKEKAAD
jgi:hypothetical protein